MSKLTTEELVETVGALAEEWYATSGDFGESPDLEANEKMRPCVDAIIARLKAADALCEAAKEAEVELSFAPCRDNPEHSFCLKCQTTENLRKAIKKHEEA